MRQLHELLDGEKVEVNIPTPTVIFDVRISTLVGVEDAHTSSKRVVVVEDPRTGLAAIRVRKTGKDVTIHPALGYPIAVLLDGCGTRQCENQVMLHHSFLLAVILGMIADCLRITDSLIQGQVTI